MAKSKYLPMRRINANKKHPLYWIWNSLFIRCYYPSHKEYAAYGGRGIRVHHSWFDFNNFIRDIGSRPSMDHQLDRVDSNLGYEIGNVQWLHRDTNNRKQRLAGKKKHA